MNSRKIYLLYVLASFFCFGSCIKEELPNTEADIITGSLPPSANFTVESIQVLNAAVVFHIKNYQGPLKFSPAFTLTPGASILPAAGTVMDFTQPQLYTVVSEDGKWSKTYSISIVNDASADNSPFKLHSFETADTVKTEAPLGSYHNFYELVASGQKTYIWASVNEGYNVLAAIMLQPGQRPSAESYPTSQTGTGKEGKGVLLQTRNTGPLGGCLAPRWRQAAFFWEISNFRFHRSIPRISAFLTRAEPCPDRLRATISIRQERISL